MAMELEILNTKGKKTSKKVSLNADVFGIEPNDHAIYLDVKLHLANQRQGTSKTKQRADVNYSTRKLKKQKGTGGARAGSIKSPLFKQGGNVFGPQPRDYNFKLNKKLRKLARKSALAQKAKDNNITVLENFTFDKPKTKEFQDIIKNLALNNKRTLLVLPEDNKNIYLSSRNIQKTKVVQASDINTYDIMNASQLVLLESSVQKLETIFK